MGLIWECVLSFASIYKVDEDFFSDLLLLQAGGKIPAVENCAVSNNEYFSVMPVVL